MKSDDKSVYAGDGGYVSDTAEAYPTGDEVQKYVAVNECSIGRITEGVFEFRTHAQAEKLTSLLALNTPDPDRASVGFWELLSNAVEHGNLEISMDEKTRLLLSGQLMEEIERRHKTSPFKDRFVRVSFRIQGTQVSLRVEDQGKGFDHAAVLQMDTPPERPNGRGLKMASEIYFDEIRYLGKGNVVEAVMRTSD